MCIQGYKKTLSTFPGVGRIPQAKARCNIGFWAGIVPENAANHTALGALLDAGALGFKSFMCPSGIDDFAHVSPHDVAAALPLLKARGVPHLLHAEMMSEVESTEVGTLWLCGAVACISAVRSARICVACCDMHIHMCGVGLVPFQLFL